MFQLLRSLTLDSSTAVEPAHFRYALTQRLDLFTDTAKKSRENENKLVKRDGAWHNTSISVILIV
jgi:hypothetical protein